MTYETDITLIAAIEKNRGLGKNGKLIVECPADMQHFRSTTRNGIVIMGRKTWESLSDQYRPLPNRDNIVITSSKEQSLFPGAYIANSIQNAKEKAQIMSYCTGQRIFVIGGGSVYEGFKDHITHAVITQYNWSVDSDTKLFEFDDTWELDHEFYHAITDPRGLIEFKYHRRKESLT